MVRLPFRAKPGTLQAALEPSQGQAAAAPLLPDGCNMGIVVRVGLGVNAGMFLAALAAGPESTVYSRTCLELAATVEPVTLLSLLTWCLFRQRVAPWSPARQRLLATAVPAAAAALLTRVGGDARGALLAALVGAACGLAVQHYFELRARAFSPAVDEARFQALQSRIRPHFLFNCLNAALAVIRADPERAERMLESLAELFRAVMGDVRRLVPLTQELELCRRYVEIEQTRLGERLQVSWDVGAVHPRARVPQLLLQPILENAVRYGAEPLSGRCDIQVRVRQRGFNLEIAVSNPIAREPVQREGNQIGLANIRGRLALIYDLEARLETRVRDGRFELGMTIPVSDKESSP